MFAIKYYSSLNIVRFEIMHKSLSSQFVIDVHNYTINPIHPINIVYCVIFSRPWGLRKCTLPLEVWESNRQAPRLHFLFVGL